MDGIKQIRKIYIVDAGEQHCTLFGDPEIGYAVEKYHALNAVYADTPGQALDLFLTQGDIYIRDGVTVYDTGEYSIEPQLCGIANLSEGEQRVFELWEKMYC